MPKGVKGFQKGHTWKGNTKGRPTKAEELGLSDKLDAIKPIAEVLQKLGEQIESGNQKALELWMNYYYGKPKQSMDLNTDFKIDAIKIVRASDSRDSDK